MGYLRLGSPTAAQSATDFVSNTIFDRVIQEHIERLEPEERDDFKNATPGTSYERSRLITQIIRSKVGHAAVSKG